MKYYTASEELALKEYLLALPPAIRKRLSVSEVEYTDDDGSKEGFVLVSMRESTFYIRLFRYQTVCAPGPGRLAEDADSSDSWMDSVRAIESWYDRASREHDAMLRLRDLEAEFAAEFPNGSFASAPENAPFSSHERAELDVDLMAFAATVGQRFDALKAQVTGVAHSVDEIKGQQAKILEAIEYMRKSADHLGKKDWAAAAVGTAMSAIMGAALPQEVARQLWLDFMSQLSHIKLLPP